ncbi:MAG TPA: DUF4328 domain-containing protein [Amycolatopsis sp.]|uniref:DUF4328 domain-containing protein n=1 Tax=Amycolatopsis sp. TaxID=37632 RepID=UPI002B47B77C|nr:DUF4328 domain-containing protein [Amycolatopsis sp.]HKS49775.1 DUF4328 domain-containing protein [Amycolatopsis sp.]
MTNPSLSPWPSPGPVRSSTGLSVAAVVCLALSVASDVAVTWTHWNAYRVLSDFWQGHAKWADVDAVDQFSRTLRLTSAGVTVVAAVVFFCWLWRARLNAESLSLSEHRLSRGWVIGAWFCPLLNLWYPHRVVSDIWKTSRPKQAETLDLSRVRGSALVTAWWVLYLAAVLIDLYATAFKFLIPLGLDDLYSGSRDNTIATVLRAVAGVLLVLVIARVTTWQNRRVAVPA